MMEKSEVIGRLSVCGLDCSRCADYEKGENDYQILLNFSVTFHKEVAVVVEEII